MKRSSNNISQNDQQLSSEDLFNSFMVKGDKHFIKNNYYIAIGFYNQAIAIGIISALPWKNLVNCHHALHNQEQANICNNMFLKIEAENIKEGDNYIGKNNEVALEYYKRAGLWSKLNTKISYGDVKKYKYPLFAFAAINGNFKILYKTLELIGRNESTIIDDMIDADIFCEVIFSNQLEMAKYLIQLTLDPKKQHAMLKDNKYNSFSQAIIINNLEMVKYLVQLAEYLDNILIANNPDNTILYEMVMSGLESEDNEESQSNFEYAVEADINILKYLIELFPDAETRFKILSENRYEIFTQAAEMGYLDKIQYLVEIAENLEMQLNKPNGEIVTKMIHNYDKKKIFPR